MFVNHPTDCSGSLWMKLKDPNTKAIYCPKTINMAKIFNHLSKVQTHACYKYFISNISNKDSKNFKKLQFVNTFCSEI